MAGLNKRELTSKPLRLDVRMAKDIESLAGHTGYSQNEIILMAIKNYLYENREYFVSKMIYDNIISIMEKEVVLLHNEAHISYNGVFIDIERADDGKLEDVDVVDASGAYKATMRLRNKAGRLFYEDERNLDAYSRAWDDYKDFVNDIAARYIDVDDQTVKAYFRQKFQYE